MAFLTEASQPGLRDKGRNTRVQSVGVLAMVPVQSRQGDRETRFDPTDGFFATGPL